MEPHGNAVRRREHHRGTGRQRPLRRGRSALHPSTAAGSARESRRPSATCRHPRPISSVSLVTDAGDNDAWDTDELVTAEVAFTGPVYIQGQPTLGITLTGTRHEAAYASGDGTATLRFSHRITSEQAGAINAGLISDGIKTDTGALFDAHAQLAVLDFDVDRERGADRPVPGRSRESRWQQQEVHRHHPVQPGTGPERLRHPPRHIHRQQRRGKESPADHETGRQPEQPLADQGQASRRKRRNPDDSGHHQLQLARRRLHDERNELLRANIANRAPHSAGRNQLSGDWSSHDYRNPAGRSNTHRRDQRHIRRRRPDRRRSHLPMAGRRRGHFRSNKLHLHAVKPRNRPRP